MADSLLLFHCLCNLTTTMTLNPPIPIHRAIFSPNPRLIPAILPPSPRPGSVFSCKGIELSGPKQRPNSLTSSSNGSLGDLNFKTALKPIDVATLGNLCVDIVLSVPQLPPASPRDRKAYMDHLSASEPDKKYWEAGGNCNMAIAAARLGLHCFTIGHVGQDIYGKFLVDVLHDEGIGMVEMNEDTDAAEISSTSFETLLCWVLVDPMQRHGFCSRADFTKEPALCWMKTLSRGVKMAIKQSKVMFCNGYGFDDLSPDMIISALEYAVEVGTSIFFDPGPRGKSLSSGTCEEQKALDQFLRMSDVLLLTSDEAESLTGIKHPILAGQELLRKGVRTKWVIVKLGARGSILISESSISCAPAFKVNVIDTVGCGDSFVAAIAFSFIHNMPLVNTLAFANAVGAATAMGCGAGRSVATMEQVIELLNASNLNMDDKFWNELLEENVNVQEITFLSDMVVTGSKNPLKCVTLQKVVSQLLPKLESARLTRTVP